MNELPPPRRDLLDRCRRAVGAPTDASADASSLAGFFQHFRPEGAGVEAIFTDLEHAEELCERLAEVYRAAGIDRRPDGARDAYFIVRRPAAIAPEEVARAAAGFFGRLAALDAEQGRGVLARLLDPLPELRVLEGLPPKSPRRGQEPCTLLAEVREVGRQLTEGIEAPEHPALVLRQAYYFIACDPFLRDHLMWPLYRASVATPEPFADYLTLWRHGVKYRIFNDRAIDLYVPRFREGVLVAP